MTNKVHIIAEGYSYTDPNDPKSMRANCSCSLIQTHNGLNIIVDTMTAWDVKLVEKAIEGHRLTCDDINYVVCTHGHSDHTGCNSLFQKAEWHFIGSCKSHGDKYPECNLDDPMPLGTDDVLLVSTPGHTLTCVSVVVHNAEVNGLGSGTVGICGDLFEREEDVWKKEIWMEAGSENEELQRSNRCKMARMCTIIIPGHGKGFVVTDKMKEQLEKDLNGNEK